MDLKQLERIGEVLYDELRRMQQYLSYITDVHVVVESKLKAKCFKEDDVSTCTTFNTTAKPMASNGVIAGVIHSLSTESEWLLV